MPVVHAIFFLHRSRASYPRWRDNYPWLPGIGGCLRYPLEVWSQPMATAVVALVAVILVHVCGYIGKVPHPRPALPPGPRPHASRQRLRHRPPRSS